MSTEKFVGTSEDDAWDFEPELDPNEGARYLIVRSQQESFARDTEDIIRRTIKKAGPTDRLQMFSERLGDYFDGNRAAASSFLLLCGFPSSELTDTLDLDQLATPEESQALRTVTRRIAGIYGYEIARAFDASEFDPANWAFLEMRYSYLPTSAIWQAELAITRFDEEKLWLDGPVTSFLRLVNYLVAELTRMPVEAEAFGDELEVFRLGSTEFLDQYNEDDS